MASTTCVYHASEVSCCHRAHNPDHITMERHKFYNRRNVKVSYDPVEVSNITVLNVANRRICWGPGKSPLEMSSNEFIRWNQHLQTPVLFNNHQPYEVNSSTIQRIDLNPIHSTPRALLNEERILILTPLRDAAPYLIKYFDLLTDLTYPHHLIDLAFLVGDSTDDTLVVLSSELNRVQQQTDGIPFHSVTIVEKNFGDAEYSQDVESRHGFKAQGPRRKLMGKARNYLLSAALKPEHSWVYWRDVDIVDSPKKILEDFVAHDRDILVPSMYSLQQRDCWQLTGRRYLVSSISRWCRHRRTVRLQLLDRIG